MNFLWGIQAGVTCLEMAGSYAMLSAWEPLGKKARREKLIAAMGILTVSVLTIYQRDFILYSRFYVLFCILINFAFSAFVYQLPKLRLLCLIAIYHETLAFLDLFGLTLLGLAAGTVEAIPTLNLNMGPERMAVFGVSRGVMAAILFGMRKGRERIRQWERGIGKAIWLLPLAEHGTLYMCDIIVVPQRGQSAMRNWFFLLCLDGLLVIGMLVLYMRWTHKQYRESLLQERSAYQRSRAAEREEYRKKDRYYHDMKHHILAMELYLKNGELKELERYMEEFTGQLSDGCGEKNCADTILDLYIKEKEKEAADRKIRVDITLSEVLQLEDMELLMDLCSVIGNLWDNAIEGCERIAGERWITFLMRQQGTMFFIEMKNSCAPATKGAERQTSKAERWKHGIGLESVQAIVDKYHGNCEWSWEGETFEVSAMLFPDRMKGKNEKKEHPLRAGEV